MKPKVMHSGLFPHTTYGEPENEETYTYGTELKDIFCFAEWAMVFAQHWLRGYTAERCADVRRSNWMQNEDVGIGRSSTAPDRSKRGFSKSMQGGVDASGSCLNHSKGHGTGHEGPPAPPEKEHGYLSQTQKFVNPFIFPSRGAIQEILRRSCELGHQAICDCVAATEEREKRRFK